MLTVNPATLSLIISLSNQEALTSVSGNRGATAPLQVQFGYPFGQPIEIDAAAPLTEFKFGAKVLNDFDGPFVVSNYSDGNFVFTKTGALTIRDGGTTDASPTLTSTAQAQFAQSDVGIGVSGPGIPANTTILSVQSPTSATMSANATANGGPITFVFSPVSTNAAQAAYRTPTYSLPVGWNTNKLNNLLGYDPNGFAQETNIWCVADLAGSLAGKYFDISDSAGPVRFWFKVGGVGAAPAAPGGGRLVEVDFATNSTATVIAAAIAAAATADSAGATYLGTSWGNLAQLADVPVGLRALAPNAQASGFELEIWIAGSLPDTLPEVASVTLGAQMEYTVAGQIAKIATFNFTVNASYINGGEGIPTDANPVYPAPGALALKAWFMTQVLANAADTGAVNFAALDLTAPPSMIVAFNVGKHAAGDANLTASFIEDSQTEITANFELNAPTDNANRILHYLVIP